MSTLEERTDDAARRRAPALGVRPTPPEMRRLSGLDAFVLWGDLGIGLLVMVTGALLVPGLGLPAALLAIVAGSVIGCVPLALVGRAGAREGVPGMVLLRGVLGVRGSYVPTVLNVLQLIGWTAFELWAMALVASRITGPLFGVDSFLLWLGVAAAVCVALSLGGPVVVVRRWMERFGVWVLAGAGVWITVRVLLRADLGALWSQPGTGVVPFGTGVDFVIAMPVSWIPLVADYNRFARAARDSAVGTYWGYLVANIWFYALGALLVLAGGAIPSPAGIGDAIITLTGGALVLLVLLVGETDEAFADIYSSAVSAQNIAPRLSQRGAIVAVAAVGVALAAWLQGLPDDGVLTYEFFLLLIGSLFVPLFAVFLAEYHVLHRGTLGEGRLFERAPRFRAGPFVAWFLGFAVYHAFTEVGPAVWVRGVARVFGALGLEHPVAGGAIPASIVSFAVAFLAALVLGWFAGRR